MFRVDSLRKIKHKFGELEKVLKTDLKTVYEWVFDYCKEEQNSKVISLEYAKAYLKLLIGNRPHTLDFVAFLDKV